MSATDTGDQTIDLDDIQGNILRGYAMGSVRHLVVTVSDVAAARRFLGELASGGSGPQLTSAAPWGEKPRTCLNVGVTFTGLRALGLPKASLDSFPGEFREGAVGRAAKVGDIGASEPANQEGQQGRRQEAGRRGREEPREDPRHDAPRQPLELKSCGRADRLM